MAYEAARFVAVKEMSFSLASLDAGQSGLTTTDLSIGVDVNNPTAWTNTIDSLTGNVYLNSRYIAYASIVGPIRLPAKSITRVPVGLQLNDLSLVASILSVFVNKPAHQVVTFTGQVLADSIPIAIPLNLTYEII